MTTLTVEDGSRVTGANSYVTVAQGDDYFDHRLHADNWTNASTTEKQKALIMATKLVDDMYIWNGNRIDRDQALSWPRNSVADRDGWEILNTTIPQNLKDAVCVIALSLLAEDITAEPDTAGFKRIKADVVELEINTSDRDRYQLIPFHAHAMLGELGQVKSKAGTTAKILRS